MHARKSLLFDKNTAWVKKNNSTFDVTMGSFDGAEICELVSLYILSQLNSKYSSNGSIGLYRNDGLAAFYEISGPQADRIRNDITKCFSEHGLKMSIACNLKTVNFLDVTFNLTNGTYKPYMKPNNQPLYVNVRSNHPPSILKHLPDNINHRLSDIYRATRKRLIAANGVIRELCRPVVLLKSCPIAIRTAQKRPKNWRRNTIWYNPPYKKNVRTIVGKLFLNLIEKHFPVNNKHHKIFNKNNVKVSYGCCQNMESIVKQHNSKILNESNTVNEQGHTCNCRVRDQCPLDNNCLSSGVVCTAKVSTDDDPLGESYIGLTEGPFKF